MANRRLGLWLIGARGGVATTVCLGWAALKNGLTGSVGLTSELPQFAGLDFARWDEVIVGGHEIRESDLCHEARQFAAANRLFDPELLTQTAPDLAEVNTRIRPGTLYGVGHAIAQLASKDFVKPDLTPAAAIERIQSDLIAFKTDNQLDRVVVLNVASTEPSLAAVVPEKWSELEPILRNRECPLTASSLYAIAAIQSGAAYVNFTPSVGSELPALDELAQARRTCHIGRDGKTGETLMKSALSAHFRRTQPASSQLGRSQYLRQHGRPDSRRTREQEIQSRQQGQTATANPQLRTANTRVH